MLKRRTKFASAIVVTAASVGGCSGTNTISNPPPPDIGNPPPPVAVESYDVIVTGETVRVEPRFSSDPACRPTGIEELPAIGACVEISDAVSFPCGATANITSATVDGVTATENSFSKAFSLTVNANGDSVLLLDGVFGSVSVPLHATGLPTPTVTLTETTTGIDLAWTTDVPAASTVVDVTSGLIVKRCHVTLQSYGYVGDPSAVIGARVQPFLTLETHTSPYGDIRVWRGNGRYQSL